MCLAVPGRVLIVSRDDDVHTGAVDFGGVRRQVCLETLPQVRPGDWILVHAGFALQIVDEEAAGEILAWVSPEEPP